MRFLHTSDWHLGKSLKAHDLSEAQQDALDAIIDTAIEKEVDAFVIAGDVFDRAFPAVEDVRRLNSALTRIHQVGIPIICTAGNHDEGARLAAYMNLLEQTVTVVGEYSQVGRGVELYDDHGPVVFYPLTYLDPDGARRALATDPDTLLERSHEAVMCEAMRRIRIDLERRSEVKPGTRAVVVAHAFVLKGDQKPEESDSERDISIGGVASIPTGVFDGVDYVALGHIHGPRTLQESGPTIRYSGSILRYSVSETHHEKSVTIVDLDAEGTCTIDVVPVPQPAGMARVRGDLEELLGDDFSKHHEDFVEIVLTDTIIPDNHLAQLAERFTRILSVTFERRSSAIVDEQDDETVSITSLPPMELLRSFYQKRTDDELTESMEAVLVDVLEQSRIPGTA